MKKIRKKKSPQIVDFLVIYSSDLPTAYKENQRFADNSFTPTPLMVFVRDVNEEKELTSKSSKTWFPMVDRQSHAQDWRTLFDESWRILGNAPDNSFFHTSTACNQDESEI